MRSTKPVRVGTAEIEEVENIVGKSYGSITQYVTEAVAEKNSRTKPNSAQIKYGLSKSKIKKTDSRLNLIKRCADLIKFFGVFSEENKKIMLEKMKDEDDDTRALLERAYDVNKREVAQVKAELKTLLDIIDDAESKPKSKLEKTREEFWRIENEKIEQECQRAEELYEQYLEKEERLEREELARKERIEHQAKLRKDPLYGLRKDQKEFVRDCSKKDHITLRKAREILDGESC